MDMLQEMVAEAGADGLRWFPETHNDLVHHVLALNGEAGELANVAKKVQRGSHTWEGVRDKFLSEVADVMTYLLCIAHAAEIDLREVYYDKRAFNESRYGRPNAAPERRGGTYHPTAD